MVKAIISFEVEDIMLPRPWPIGIDENDHVTSGLPSGDIGARLIGFGVKGSQSVDILVENAYLEPEKVKGLVPTFAGHGQLFEWGAVVQELTIPEPIVDDHFQLDIQLSNSEMTTSGDVARALREVAEFLDNFGTLDTSDVNQRINDINGHKVGAWSIVEVARA